MVFKVLLAKNVKKYSGRGNNVKHLIGIHKRKNTKFKIRLLNRNVRRFRKSLIFSHKKTHYYSIKIIIFISLIFSTNTIVENRRCLRVNCYVFVKHLGGYRILNAVKKR